MKTINIFDDTSVACCFTGYRPAKFPFPLKKGDKEYTEFENRLTETVLSLCDRGVLTFYTGMAMGFDIIAAETVLNIRDMCFSKAVRLSAVVPFKGQPSSFDEEWRRRYETVLSSADETVVLSNDYYNGCFHRRNKFMVDNSEVVVTWFDGQSGGTASTLHYADRRQKEIINLFDCREEKEPLVYFDCDTDAE